tara:strand:- start:2673 stop:3692 length:1020 start_codon:yes stop_codon:yes gene_type:complete
MIKKEDAVRPIWFSRSKQVVEEINEQYPGHAVKSPSLKAAMTYLRAKRIVISHSFLDMCLMPYTNNKEINYLWHGVPLRKIGKMVDENRGLAASRIISHWSRWNRRVDFFYASSNYEAEIMKRAFLIEGMNIEVSGYPRNDCLFDFIQEKKGDGEEVVILYAPTHREAIHGGETGFLPILHPDFSEGEIHYFLEKMKSRLIIRPHPISSTGKCTSDRIEYITVDQVPDISELFRTSDILVTDYSSTYFDWLILDKPIIFSIYDFQEYGEEIGFIEEFEDIAAGQIALTKEELLESLEKSIKKSDYDVDKRMKVREMIGMARGDSCRRISKSIISRIELK